MPTGGHQYHAVPQHDVSLDESVSGLPPVIPISVLLQQNGVPIQHVEVDTTALPAASTSLEPHQAPNVLQEMRRNFNSANRIPKITLCTHCNKEVRSQVKCHIGNEYA